MVSSEASDEVSDEASSEDSAELLAAGFHKKSVTRAAAAVQTGVLDRLVGCP